MKKITLLVVLVFTIAFSAFAQNKDRFSISMGVGRSDMPYDTRVPSLSYNLGVKLSELYNVNVFTSIGSRRMISSTHNIGERVINEYSKDKFTTFGTNFNISPINSKLKYYMNIGLGMQFLSYHYQYNDTLYTNEPVYFHIKDIKHNGININASLLNGFKLNNKFRFDFMSRLLFIKGLPSYSDYDSENKGSSSYGYGFGPANKVIPQFTLALTYTFQK